MRLSSLVSLPEILHIKKFFDGVDSFVSREIDKEHLAYEESLSFLFGRLLDESSAFQAALPYRLPHLNDDLAECGGGNQLHIEFETNEHAKGFSGSTSRVDLGIIFRFNNPGLGQTVEKAILVECKRLYPEKGVYSLNSVYRGFKEKQYKDLKDIANKYGKGGIYYFLYNPILASFEDKSGQHIRALENQQFNYRLYSTFWHELSFKRGFIDENALKRLMIEYTAARPGIKVLGLSGIGKIVEKAGSVKPLDFTLSSCYQYPKKDDWYEREDGVPFVSLSEFIVDLFMECVRGSKSGEIKMIAEGRKPDTSTGRQPSEIEGNITDTILASHTLRINMTSSLPQLG